MAVWRWLWLLATILVCDAASNYRLTGEVIPKHYDLKILPYIDEAKNFTFTGTVAIQLEVIKETKAITLHSLDLEIDESSIKLLNGKEAVPVVNVTRDKAVDFLTLQAGDVLKSGKEYELVISFSGILLESLVGFYRSSYKNSETGEKVWLATTQFEATDARRAFPCFDEPAMKATFTVTLGRKEELTAISNMPLQETKPIEGMKGWQWDTFQKSVPMSTYLLAFIISDFEYVQSPLYKNNVIFKIWARKDAINQTGYASEVGPKVLAYYEEYYDVPYPLPKQDMVAIPDFSAGAMENWGLITYRETALLYSETRSSTTSKARVASVIAHELAHQWFGNLVTMEWWTDLWLNEGFATYMATLGLDHVHPDWNVLQEESADNLVDVFRLDVLDSSHPVSVPIGEPSEISQIFDTISYKKGSAIIRMMNLFLGEKAFRDGVSNYLKKYKYKNAAQDDLWQSLTEAAHKVEALPKDYTVKQIMDSWTKQTGYPLVTVTRDYDKNSALVAQQHYQEKKGKARSTSPLWWVPLSVWSAGSPQPSQVPSSWLAGEASVTLNSMPNKDNWVLFNIDMAGVYRVNYDDRNWGLLKEALKGSNHSGIPVLSRFQLITDSMSLASANHMPYAQSISLLEYLKTEESYLPWKAALSSLSKVSFGLNKSPQYGAFKNYMRTLLEPNYLRLGGLHTKVVATPGKLDAVKHQILISSWSCNMGVADCEENAQDLFQQWMTKENPDVENPIQNDLRNIVYCHGISKGGEKEFEFLWQRYIRANVASEKGTILNALGCAKYTWLLARLLEQSITVNSEIRKQDSTSAFHSVCHEGLGYYVAREFLYSRIQDISKFHKKQLKVLGSYVKAIANRIVSRHEQKELIRWTEENKELLQESSLSVKQALESVSNNLDWVENHRDNVLQVLQNLTMSKI